MIHLIEPKRRKEYSKEFKQEVAERMILESLTCRQASEIYGICVDNAWRWRNQFSP
jgi:transposase-like protein